MRVGVADRTHSSQPTADSHSPDYRCRFPCDTPHNFLKKFAPAAQHFINAAFAGLEALHIRHRMIRRINLFAKPSAVSIKIPRPRNSKASITATIQTGMAVSAAVGSASVLQVDFGSAFISQRQHWWRARAGGASPALKRWRVRADSADRQRAPAPCRWAQFQILPAGSRPRSASKHHRW